MAEEKASTNDILNDQLIERTDSEWKATSTVTETTVETTVVADEEGNVISSSSTRETVVTENTSGEGLISDIVSSSPQLDNNELKKEETTEATGHGKEPTGDEKHEDGAGSIEKKKKTKKPLSPALQRLTAAKKTYEPTDTGPTSEERKAKANKMRQSKISEHRKQEDDKRAAVLERKRRLEEEERKKKEALLKKLTADTPAPVKSKPSMKRYSSSTSNLTQLKKTKPVEAKIDIAEKSDKDKLSTKAPARPSSAMSRTRPVSASNLHSKTKPSTEKKAASDVKKTTTTKAPPTRMSLAPRPATALGVSADRRKTLPAKTTTSTKSAASKNATLTSTTKPITKDTTKKEHVRPASTSVAKKPASKTTTASSRPSSVKSKDIKKSDESKKPTSAATKKPGSTTTTPKKSGLTKTTTKTSTATTKKAATPKASTESPAATAGKMTEEEAKKALSERRKKAKEEAEAKARAEREKDELERLKREEEEKRLAQQLKEEEERQAALLEQLKIEEEERQKKMLEEKEQREREEKERIEAEAKQRDEEIERKAKIEAERIQKEQQKKDEESEAERVERKKRVELIMARVSASRAGSASTDSPAKSTEDESQSSARLKVDGILKSKGLGRSTENLLDTQNEQTISSEVTGAEIEDSNENGKPAEEAASITQNTDLENKIEVSQETVVVENQQLFKDLSPQTVVDEKANDENSLDIFNNETNKTKESAIEKTSERLIQLKIEPIVSETNTEIELVSHDQLHSDNNNTTKESPVIAWTADTPSSDLIVAEEKIADMKIESTVASNELTVETTTVEADAQSSEIVVMTSSVVEETRQVGEERVQDVDVSDTTEKEQWSQFESRMNDIQQETKPTEISSEEAKLWKLAEGKVELSECF